MYTTLAIIALLLFPGDGWGRCPEYKIDTHEETVEADNSEAAIVTPTAKPVDYLMESELKMLYRLGYSECRAFGDARDDCVKGVTSVVLSRIALGSKMDGAWSLSDGTIWGTMSIYNEIPQFTPWIWDDTFCLQWPDHHFCTSKPDLAPYYSPVRAAVNGDGGPCAGYLFFSHEQPPNPQDACTIQGSQQIMHFHNGWGENDILENDEWLRWLERYIEG